MAAGGGGCVGGWFVWRCGAPEYRYVQATQTSSGPVDWTDTSKRVIMWGFSQHQLETSLWADLRLIRSLNVNHTAVFGYRAVRHTALQKRTFSGPFFKRQGRQLLQELLVYRNKTFNTVQACIYDINNGFKALFQIWFFMEPK